MGDGLTLLGLGLTSTGALAEVGVPLAALGETISAVGTVAEHIDNVDDIIYGDLLFSDFVIDLAIDLGLNFVPNAYENVISTTVDEFREVWTDIGVDSFLIEAWSMGSERWIDFMKQTNDDRMTTP